jgi:hypothetical protein
LRFGTVPTLMKGAFRMDENPTPIRSLKGLKVLQDYRDRL